MSTRVFRYVARGLSWQGAEFSTNVALLDASFRAIYDAAVAFMVELRGALDEACQRTKSKKAKRSYWGLHVRFFKELCVAAKVKRRRTSNEIKSVCEIEFAKGDEDGYGHFVSMLNTASSALPSEFALLSVREGMLYA